MKTKSISDRIKSKAHEIGFELVGITTAKRHADLTRFEDWLGKSFDGTMAYLKRRREDRADPQRLLPGAKTLICCGLNYYGGEPGSQDLELEGHGWISRYAWGEDYHRVVLQKLTQLEDFIRKEIAPTARLKSYVDTGPILERSYAASAGLGWIGKNTLLINRQCGSYFFIAEILTDLDLLSDIPETDHCGHCRLCLDACPTQALTPYELDATRCISYLTIEHRGEISLELQPQLGHHVFGCDICQEVCPWNQAIPLSEETAFQPRTGLHHPKLTELKQLDESEFREIFRDSAVQRSKWKGFQRNLSIVQNNQRNKGPG